MTAMKPNDLLRAWKKSTAIDRIDACRMMLRIHGFLSDNENESVKRRIAKWIEQHEADDDASR